MLMSRTFRPSIGKNKKDCAECRSERRDDGGQEEERPASQMTGAWPARSECCLTGPACAGNVPCNDDGQAENMAKFGRAVKRVEGEVVSRGARMRLTSEGQ